jgi:photosystem II stability/assembly factor-like uncharacterized protein
MKYQLLLSFLLFCQILKAQYAPFPAPNMEYGTIYVCNIFDCPGYGYYNTSMRYDGSDSLCGLKWFRFVDIQTPTYVYYIRVDEGKYYTCTNCNNQRLMYDFSKNLGDTFDIAELQSFKVTEVGTYTLLDGSIRKKITIKGYPPSYSVKYTWVDGIGDLEAGFFRDHDIEGGYRKLICLRDAAGIYFHSASSYLDCDSLLCPEPTPKFDFSCNGKKFQFINQSLDASSYFWDFGDGTTSTEESPSHDYTAPGCFTVTLIARTKCYTQYYMFTQIVAVEVPVNWTPLGTSVPPLFQSVQFVDSLNAWAFDEKSLYKSTDGGEHWDQVSYPGPLRVISNISFSDAQHGMMSITKAGMYYYEEILWTNDGGAHWTPYQIGNYVHFSAIERLNDNTGLIADGNLGIFVTKNGGVKWTNIYGLDNVSTFNDFFPAGDGSVYFTGLNEIGTPSYRFRFGKSTNLMDWEVNEYMDTLLVPGSGNMFFTSPQKGFVCGKNGLLTTLDSGIHWQKVPEAEGYFSFLQFADSLHGWTCGFSGGIYGTTDGGQSWQQQNCATITEKTVGLSVRSATQAQAVIDSDWYVFHPAAVTYNNCGVSATTTLNTEKQVLTLYPNPTSAAFHLNWPGDPDEVVECTLLNALGRLVKYQRNSAAAEISVSDLPAGMYYVQVRRPNTAETYWGKIVVCVRF